MKLTKQAFYTISADYRQLARHSGRQFTRAVKRFGNVLVTYHGIDDARLLARINAGGRLSYRLVPPAGRIAPRIGGQS